MTKSSSSLTTLAQPLLLLMLVLTPAPSLTSMAAGVAVKSPDKLQVLRQLREMVASELERRESGGASVQDDNAVWPVKRAGSDAATLGDVLAGAKAFGSSVTADAPPSPPPPPGTTFIPEEAVTTSWSNGTHPAGLFSPLWFSHLLASTLSVMPLAAWIAVLCTVGLLLCILLGLIIYCCCCRRGRRDRIDGRRRNRDDGAAQKLTYNDLDIIGKEQPPYGVINFSLEYDLPTCQLIITASSCIGLPKELKELDPYVVVHVSPDPMVDSKKHHAHPTTAPLERSKVVKNSVNPAFNYTRIVKIKDKRKLKHTVIKFEVFDWDIGTRHRMIARRVLNLAKLGENLDDILCRKMEYSRNLQAGVNEEATGPGDICLALCYSTQDRHLWVHIIECKGVFLLHYGEPDFDTLPNTYVKLALSMAGSNKRMTRSTKLIKASRNPYFNEQFIFKIESRQMMYASLTLSLVHRTETLGIKRIIGSQTLSMRADKDSLAQLHWKEASAEANQGRPMARWHSLVTPEEERRQADLKAAAELKREMERAEDESAAALFAAAGAGAASIEH